MIPWNSVMKRISLMCHKCHHSIHSHHMQMCNKCHKTPPCSLSSGTPVSPNCSKPLQAQGTPQSDVSPGTPVSSNCSKSPQAQGTPQSDVSPGTPVSPNCSQSPEAQGTPQSDVQQVPPCSPNGDNKSLPLDSPHSEVPPSSSNGDNASLPLLSPQSEVAPSYPNGDNKSLPLDSPHSEVPPSSPNGDNASLPPLSTHNEIEEVPLGSPSSASASQILPKKDGAFHENNIVNKRCPYESQDLAEAVGASNDDKILDVSEETIVYSCPEDEKINKPKPKKELKQKLSCKSSHASGKHTKVKRTKTDMFFCEDVFHTNKERN